MPTQASMVADLKFWGAVQSSEGFSDSDLGAIVSRATNLHNGSYVCDSTECTIPDAEVDAISTLAQALLAQLRATKAAQASSPRSADFQPYTKDTPFEKNMALFDSLMDQYEEKCKALGLIDYYGASQIAVMEYTAENMDHGAMTPLEIALEPPVVNLGLPAEPVEGTTVLVFATKIFGQFLRRHVFHITGGEPLYQPWNVGKAVFPVPKVNDAADYLLNTENQRWHSLKVTNLEMSSGTVHRFLIVTENKSGIFGYSNEVTVATP